MPLSFKLNVESIMEGVEVDTFVAFFEYSDVPNVLQVVTDFRVDTETSCLLEGEEFGIFIDNHTFNLACYEKRSS